MSDHRSSDVFEPDRTWLEGQQGLTPWKKGCLWLKRQLDGWLRRYSEAVCEKPVTDRDADYPCFFRRLWICWSHHWRQAISKAPDGKTDGLEVANQIQSGQGYSGGGRLGGDPLRDVVLAVAVTKKNDRATEYFHSDYFGFLKGLAGKKDRQFLRDTDEWGNPAWWNPFLDHLAGYTKPPGKLKRFYGKCALRNWLPVVLWRFLTPRRSPGDANCDSLDDNSPPATTSADDPARRECVELFAELVALAMAELPKQDRLLLSLLYIDGLKQKDAAQVLGVNPGNVTRRKDRAIQALGKLTAEHAERLGKQESYHECLSYLTEEGKDFAQTLREALEQYHGEEGEQ